MSNFNPEVKDIVKDWLVTHGYDGLFSEDCCACEINDLAPCGGEIEHCEAGYKEAGCTCGEGCDFHIVREKRDVLEKERD